MHLGTRPLTAGLFRRSKVSFVCHLLAGRSLLVITVCCCSPSYNAPRENRREGFYIVQTQAAPWFSYKLAASPVISSRLLHLRCNTCHIFSPLRNSRRSSYNTLSSTGNSRSRWLPFYSRLSSLYAAVSTDVFSSVRTGIRTIIRFVFERGNCCFVWVIVGWVKRGLV